MLSTLNLLATGAALGWAGVATARLCGAQRERAITAGLIAAAIGLLSEPLLMTVHYGQINVYLMALVLWDFTRAPGSRVSGIGIGLAAAIKVTPAVFVIYLLATRRFAMAGRTVAMFTVTIVFSLAVDARATAAFWTDHLFDTRRVGHVENAVNQSIRGWLVRAHHSHAIPSAELLIVVAAAIFGLVAAVRVHRVAGDRWGVPAAAVTGLLCSPIAWSHHWVWCVPILLLLWFEHRYLLLAAGAMIFFSWAVWTIPHGGMGAPVELHLTWWQVLLSGWYVLFGLAFLGVTLRRAAQR